MRTKSNVMYKVDEEMVIDSLEDRIFRNSYHLWQFKGYHSWRRTRYLLTMQTQQTRKQVRNCKNYKENFEVKKNHIIHVSAGLKDWRPKPQRKAVKR
jgi:hypothetical protein